MKYFFTILSLSAMSYALCLHFLTFIKPYKQLSHSPYLVLFIIGVFSALGWGLLSKILVKKQEIQKKHNKLFFIIFSLILMYLFFVLFKAGYLWDTGVVSIVDGKKVMFNHGTIIKELSDTEYISLKTWQLRLQSVACVLLFYVLLGFCCSYNLDAGEHRVPNGKN